MKEYYTVVLNIFAFLQFEKVAIELLYIWNTSFQCYMTKCSRNPDSTDEGVEIKSLTKIVIACLVLGMLLVTYLSLPYIVMGKPGVLFYVQNHEDVNHNVIVEVFDLNGNRIAMEEGYPGLEYISHPRSLWQSLPISREYVFKVTVDGKVEENSVVEIGNPFGAVDISISGSGNDTMRDVYVHMEFIQTE